MHIFCSAIWMNNLINRPEYQSIKYELLKLLDKHIAKHDKLLLWEDLIRWLGLVDEWNKSQAYFHLPLLAD